MIHKENHKTNIVLRKASVEDRENILEVERKSTPKLQYLPQVFDLFVSDEIGEFSVAEIDHEIVACGKFTLMPDGSAWLETLRVIPECQGLGIGKRFYERFFELAHLNRVTTMRMYTGIKNATSKGLAERFGFRVVGTYRGAWLPCRADALRMSAKSVAFQQITDPEQAAALLMPFREQWTGFFVMNRTFYAITPALCVDFAQHGFIYEDAVSGSVIAMGARFMPEHALHIGVFGGNVTDCLTFALQQGIQRGVERLSCLFPLSDKDMQQTLLQHGFQREASDFIVMEVQV